MAATAFPMGDGAYGSFSLSGKLSLGHSQLFASVNQTLGEGIGIHWSKFSIDGYGVDCYKKLATVRFC